MSPNAYIIAGPNGAGKTTFAREYLPQHAECRNFINADLIAQGISPFAPEAAAFRAGRLVLQEIDSAMKRQEDFGIETTLSGRSYLKLLGDLRDSGYALHFFFLWLPKVEMAISRVRERVLKGGHDIPEGDLRRRFDRSLNNFLMHYRYLASSWMLFDNSRRPPLLIALENADGFRIMEERIFKGLSEQLEKDR